MSGEMKCDVCGASVEFCDGYKYPSVGSVCNGDQRREWRAIVAGLTAERDTARAALEVATKALEAVVAMEHKSNATEATRLACGDPCPCVNQAVTPARAALEAISRIAAPPDGGTGA